MPHSYGASFSGVGFLGPSRTDRPIMTPAKPTPRAIMITTPSQPSMNPLYVSEESACEEFPKPAHAIERRRFPSIAAHTRGGRKVRFPRRENEVYMKLRVSAILTLLTVLGAGAQQPTPPQVPPGAQIDTPIFRS